jgi:hypothetical protein
MSGEISTQDRRRRERPIRRTRHREQSVPVDPVVGKLAERVMEKYELAREDVLAALSHGLGR